MTDDRHNIVLNKSLDIGMGKQGNCIAAPGAAIVRDAARLLQEGCKLE